MGVGLNKVRATNKHEKWLSNPYFGARIGRSILGYIVQHKSKHGVAAI